LKRKEDSSIFHNDKISFLPSKLAEIRQLGESRSRGTHEVGEGRGKRSENLILKLFRLLFLRKIKKPVNQ